ncbi:MAG TPA: MDR family MFS transporter [Acidimicrobiales bacterium]|nr:MDR family MFS transporter [Acidimicrobiales bacterium]
MQLRLPASNQNVAAVFGALLLAQILSGLDTIILVTALPTIVGDLGGLKDLSWVITIYLLTSTAVAPLAGKLSDMMGRKALFQLSLVVFLVGSALSGQSRSLLELILFRGIQGIGGGGLGVLGRTIVADIVPGRQLGRLQGILTSSFAISSVAGPLVGGLLVDHASWRWIFYINMPIGILALVVVGVTLDLPRNPRRVQVDYAGSVLMTASMSCLLLATTWAGIRFGWGSAPIVGLLAGGCALAAAFVLVEARTGEAVLPVHLFRNRVFAVASASGLVLGMAMFGPWTVMPIFLQVVTGASATNSGVLLLPLLISFTVSSVATGFLITRYGRYRVFPIAGTALMVVGLTLYTRMGISTSRLEASVYMLVVGVGIGLMLEVLTIAVQNSIHPRDLGAATAGVGLFNSLGGAFGTAVYLSILNGAMAHWLPRLVPRSVHLAAGVLQGSPTGIRALAPGVRHGVVEAFARSLHTVFVWVVPLGVVGLLMVIFLPEVPLREQSASELLAAEGAGIDGLHPDTRSA